MAETPDIIDVKVSVDISEVKVLGAVVKVYDERKRQIELGYTPEHDREAGTGHLVAEALARVMHPGEFPTPAALRQAWLEAAALLVVAAVEVIDFEQETGQ